MPHSTHATTPQPAPAANDRPAVWDLVIADMQARDADGRAKYGVPLQPHNGRDALVDAYQEALDLAVYLRQEIEERRSPAVSEPANRSDRATFRDQIHAMLDQYETDSADDAAEIARLESELRAARRSLEYAQAECNALLGEVRRLRWEGTRGDWLRELWTALGVPAQAQALAEVKRLQRQASEVLRATGAQSHEEAMATVRALYHAAASGAEVAGELVAVKQDRRVCAALQPTPVSDLEGLARREAAASPIADTGIAPAPASEVLP